MVMATLDPIARQTIPRLLPFLEDGDAQLAERYVAEGEPVMGLEQAVLALVQTETPVPGAVLEPLVEAVEKRAAEGGDVAFLADPLRQIKREADCRAPEGRPPSS
jgi:hypothetical protein